MLLDVPCFLHDMFGEGVTLLRSGRNGRAAGRKFKWKGKMCEVLKKLRKL
jgi:hypothetical protein